MQTDQPALASSPFVPSPSHGGDGQSSAAELTRLVGGLGLLGTTGAAIGLFGWMMRWRDDLMPYARRNEMDPVIRKYATLNAGLGVGIAALAAVTLIGWRRSEGARMAARLGMRVAPLAMIVFLPFLLDAKLWGSENLTCLVLALLFGLGTGRLTNAALAAPKVFPLGVGAMLPPVQDVLDRATAAVRRGLAFVRRRAWLPTLVVLGGGAFYAAYFAHHTLNTHYRLGTFAADLGIEDNLIWNALHGGPFFKSSPLGDSQASHAGIHQSFFAYLIVPFYALFPGPRTLLVIQAIMIAAAAVPLYLFARKRLAAWTACLIALLYLLYPPVHGANLYDFHYQPLSTVFILSAVFFLDARRDGLAALAILLAFSCREDIPAMIAVVGAFFLLTGERPKAGLVVALIGGVVFGIWKFAVLPRFFQGEESFVNQYADMLPAGDNGFSGVLKTVFENPFFTLDHLLRQDKLIYVLQFLAPLALLPLHRGIGYLLVLPGFFFTLLSTRYPPLVQISFQYTAYWIPFLFVGVVVALERKRTEAAGKGRPEGASRGWLVGFAAAMLVCSFGHGAILDTTNARGGFGPYRFGLTAADRQRHDDAYGLIAQIPAGARVSAGEKISPHVTDRPDAYTLRRGIYDAEYLIFETPLWRPEREPVRQALAKEGFGVVDVRGEFVLARRGHPGDRNREVLEKNDLN